MGWTEDLTKFHEENVGDEHFIDCASRDCTISQLTKHITTKTANILEVGCSSGFFLQNMKASFPKANIIGSDILDESLQKISKIVPNISLHRFDITSCPLPDNSLDAVIMLNVLEHIKDDNLALKHVYRILKPGGILVLEVPSGPKLYDFYDKYMQHYRRYTLSNLSHLVENQGFNIIKKSHLGFLLYPFFWFIKKRNQKQNIYSEQEQQEKVKKEMVYMKKNTFMNIIMKIELFIGNYIQYPFGIRCIMTCKK